MSFPRIRELTPPGRGAVSVLSLEGPGALELVSRWSGRAIASGKLVVARLSIRGETLDEALVVALSPERVEVHLHGSPPLVEALCAELDRAEAGVGLEARAARALSSAPGEEAARILLDQSEGALRAELTRLLEEEDGVFTAGLGALVERSALARRALEPARVVLAGEANAGKSTLFNLLVASERVITSPEAGTTRDAIAEPARLGVWPVLLIDTAGDRVAVGEDAVARLEREAGRLAERARASADLILWLRPPGFPPPPPAAEGGRRVVLPSKGDLLPGGAPEGISVETDPDGARAEVERLFRESLGLPERFWRPGLAVAFDEASRVALAAARRAASGTAREKVRALLDEGAAEDC